MSRDIPEHVKQRLDRLARQVNDLEAENAALKATGKQGPPLLVDVARVLAHADAWGSHGVPASPIGEGGRSKPSSKPPAASGDRRVRSALSGFERDVSQAVSRYEQRVDGEWRRVEVSRVRPDADGWLSRIPSVRCGVRGCRKWNPVLRVDPVGLVVEPVGVCLGCNNVLPELSPMA